MTLFSFPLLILCFVFVFVQLITAYNSNGSVYNVDTYSSFKPRYLANYCVLSEKEDIFGQIWSISFQRWYYFRLKRSSLRDMKLKAYLQSCHLYRWYSAYSSVHQLIHLASRVTTKIKLKGECCSVTDGATFANLVYHEFQYTTKFNSKYRRTACLTKSDQNNGEFYQTFEIYTPVHIHTMNMNDFCVNCGKFDNRD